MSVNEPLHDPADLLDELDAVIREQELLRLRAIALQARYRALEPFAGRYDKPGNTPWACDEYGELNVKYTAEGLGSAADDMARTLKYGLRYVRGLAAKVREYPQPEREQVDRSRVERGRSR
ncbi:hypothetical protein IU459_04525 [Nocardia amamiensis]|uniref:DUF222 domain-containing protein n=1 Tax=Nocardia amamiensis TaxID=404578 RepID=A0ABS0CJN4_9NOCA|nr:hypothetical protein [Nocardia amamiensis]MBF6296809.1 hypothetical protein [Nocardia amamiensis]